MSKIENGRSYCKKERSVGFVFPSAMQSQILSFAEFVLQFIEFSVGRGVCLPAGWVQWHAFMTISSEEGAQPVYACV